MATEDTASHLTEIHIGGYRSLRDLRVPLGPLIVIVGENGSGKTNLYRALFLLHAAARGELARTMAEEGGMPSALWAGPRRKGPVRLTMNVTFSDGLFYELSSGLPEINDLPSAFSLDPLIKAETVRYGKAVLLDRGRTGAMLRDAEGSRTDFPMTFARSESVLSQIADPHRFPYLTLLRERLSKWRFYHSFRSDSGAPVRQPQAGVFTPVLSHDGIDLAAALQTICEIGDADALFRAVRQGLDGATLRILYGDIQDARFRVQLEAPGLLRPLDAWEFSDGMVRYLCLLAALLSPRPPALLALNEPETSLHTGLLAPLATHIVEASRHSQIWITTHSLPLASEIERMTGVAPLRLRKIDGATEIR